MPIENRSNHKIKNKRKLTTGHCKIRKRRTPYSSSSLNHSILFKRATGRRAGTSTPVNMASRSPVNEGSLSARKLAASLWEIDGGEKPREKKKGKERIGKLIDEENDALDRRRGRVFEAEFPQFCILTKKGDGVKMDRQRRSGKKLQVTEYVGDGGVDLVANDCLIESTSYAAAGNSGSIKARLKDVRNSLTASKELVKVLYRMLSEEEEHSWSLTLVSAIKVEIDRARIQINQAIQEHCFTNNEVDVLLKQFAAERAAWKSKEKERIHEALRELGTEKRMRRQAERLNKKLGSELANARADLSKATKDLDSERRAREVLEQTCNELARGIGEDRQEVEELKRESVKAREEVEEEREMLQLADVLREERVQMKLAEARYEFEEKTAALEKLRSELEGHFGDSGVLENGDGSPFLEPNREYAEFLKKILDFRKNGLREHSEEEESAGSNSHSIELNMDDKNKIYKWGFAHDNGSSQAESRRPSVEEMFKGRKSLCEKIQWENICLYKKGSDGAAGNKESNTNGYDRPKASAVYPEDEIIASEDKTKQRSGKSLKDYMYPSLKAASRQGSLSPAMESSVAGAVQTNSRRF
ncbi:hypothetical protein Droror1_Dr00019211 [Drosera rotundifolia]